MAKSKKAKKKPNKNRQQSVPGTMVDDKWVGPLTVSKTELQPLRELYAVATEIYLHRVNGAQAITYDVLGPAPVPHMELSDELRALSEKAFGSLRDVDEDEDSFPNGIYVAEGYSKQETTELCAYIASAPMIHEINGDSLTRDERVLKAFTLASYSTDMLLLYIFEAGAQIVLATNHAKIDAIIESAHRGKARSILEGDKGIVSSWIANLTEIVAGNCHGTMRPLNNLLLQYLGQEVDVEDEILNHPFTISLTGNLLNDIYSNAAVRACESMELDSIIDFAEKLMLLNLKQFFTAADSNFREWAFLPPLPMFTDDLEGAADIIENAESDTAIEDYFATMRPLFGARTIIPQTPLGDVPQSPQQFMSFMFDNPRDTLVFCKHNGGNELGDISSDCYLKWQPSLEDWRQNRSVKLQMIDAAMNDAGKAFNGINLNYLIAKKDSAVFEHQFDVSDFTAGEYGHNIHLAADSIDAIANERSVYKLLKENIAEKRKSSSKGISASIREREQQASQTVKESETKTRELNEQNKILRRKNQKLMERVNFLEGSLSKAEKETEQTETKIQHTSEEVSSLMQELSSLREALLNVDKKDEDCAEARDIDTSIFNDLRIVCCGGHESWAKEMRTLHPNVKIHSGSDMQVDEKVLRNADVIWLITNAISHSSFYRITAVAARYHIPVRYFRYWGHRQCKKQLATETQMMFG